MRTQCAAPMVLSVVVAQDSPLGAPRVKETGEWDKVVQDTELRLVAIDLLELLDRDGGSEADREYQDLLRYYVFARPAYARDPVKLDELDGMKARAERSHTGAQRLVKHAQALLEIIEDYVAQGDRPAAVQVFGEMQALRSRREMFQDDRVPEMDGIIRAAEKRPAELRRKSAAAERPPAGRGSRAPADK